MPRTPPLNPPLSISGLYVILEAPNIGFLCSILYIIMVSVLASRSGRVKPKIAKLVLVAYPLSIKIGGRAKGVGSELERHVYRRNVDSVS
jgi:hypothetical protein